MRLNKETGSSWFGRLTAVVCLVTVLSQLPMFVENRITSMVAIPGWVLLFGVAMFRCHGIINLTEMVRPLLIVLALAVFYCIRAIFNANYLRSDLPYPIVVSVFILLTGTMAGKLLKEGDLRLISQSYILSCVALAINVYVKYFKGVEADARIYLYEEKNSTAQILMTAVILIVTVHLNDKRAKWKLAYIAALALFIAELLMIRSRATIIFFPFLVCLVLISKGIDKKVKWGTGIATAVLVGVLIWNEEFRDELLYDVLYAGRDAADINAISSGRWVEWGSFFSDLGDGWLLGHGNMKRESLILVAFLEYGIIFGTLILVLAVYPLYYGLQKIHRSNPYRDLMVYVALCYVLNGVFEQQAPFGPGVKCFFLWFLFGVLGCEEWKHMESKQ